MPNAIGQVRDFGQTGRSPVSKDLDRFIWGGAAVAFFVSAAALGVYEWRDAQHFDRAYTVDWSVAGPHCPTLTASAVQSLELANQNPFAFGGVRGTMVSGAVTCTVLDLAGGRAVRPYTVCQFSSPFVISLKTPRGAVYFEPGVGKPATVSFRDGHLGCVVGAKTTYWGRVPPELS